MSGLLDCRAWRFQPEIDYVGAPIRTRALNILGANPTIHPTSSSAILGTIRRHRMRFPNISDQSDASAPLRMKRTHLIVPRSSVRSPPVRPDSGVFVASHYSRYENDWAVEWYLMTALPISETYRAMLGVSLIKYDG